MTTNNPQTPDPNAPAPTPVTGDSSPVPEAAGAATAPGDPSPGASAGEGEHAGTVDPAAPPQVSQTPAAVVEPPKEDWKDARIRVLTAKLRQRAEAVPPAPADSTAGATEAEINRRAAARRVLLPFARRHRLRRTTATV